MTTLFRDALFVARLLFAPPHPARCVLVLIVVHAVVCASRQPIGFGQEKALDRCAVCRLLPAPVLEPAARCSFLCCDVCGGALCCDDGVVPSMGSLADRSTPRAACHPGVGSKYVAERHDRRQAERRTNVGSTLQEEAACCGEAARPQHDAEVGGSDEQAVGCVFVCRHSLSLAHSLSVAMLLCCVCAQRVRFAPSARLW